MDNYSEIPKNERLNLLIADLTNLSGQFGELERRVEGILVSNDEGYKNIIPELQTIFAGRKTEGLGFSVGSGGTLSLLPDLPINIAIVADVNTAVLEFTQLVADLILTEDSPEAVLQHFKSPELVKQHPILKEIIAIYGDLDLINHYLTQEAKEFGQWHWTNIQRFPQVKEALKTKPIIYLEVDITNDDFAGSFVSVLNRYAEKIAFANFTNIHFWVEPRTMDFTKKWPFSENAPILFASKKGARLGGFRKVTITQSLEHYVQAYREDLR